MWIYTYMCVNIHVYIYTFLYICIYTHNAYVFALIKQMQK